MEANENFTSEKHQYTRIHAYSAYKQSGAHSYREKKIYVHIYKHIRLKRLTARNLPIYIYIYILTISVLILYCVFQQHIECCLMDYNDLEYEPKQTNKQINTIKRDDSLCVFFLFISQF